ncbi:MAG: polysaccharide pyruvyl transferase family protein [Planctomycetota bacterium]
MPFKNFVISAVDSFANRGVEALVQATLAGIFRQREDASAVVLSNAHAYNAARIDDARVRCETDWFQTGRVRMHMKSGPPARLVTKRFAPRLRNLDATLADADVFVLSGGDLLSSDYGSPASWLSQVHYAASKGLPVVLLSHSIGPFKNDDHRRSFMDAIPSISLVTARERRSFDYLTQDLGMSAEKVRHTADVAFLLERAPRAWAEKVVRHLGLSTDRAIVGLSVSGGIAKYVGSNSERHMDQLVGLVDAVRQKLEAQVLVVPHAANPQNADSDLFVATKLIERLGYPEDVAVAALDLSASQYKGLLASCDFVVAERMHAAIGALSSEVPTCVISYSVKAPGIVADVVGEDWLDRLVVPLDHFLANDGVDKVLAAWPARGDIVSILKGRLSSIREASQRNFDALFELEAAGGVG